MSAAPHAETSLPAAAAGPWDALVIGAGAAGLTAAIFAGRTGARVLVLETRPAPGAKIRVSGGGRCNVLPSRVSLDDYATSGSMHTLRNILFAWPLDAVRRFFEVELGIPLKVEPNGKVFPQSDRSIDIVQALLRECGRVGVAIRGGARVESIGRAPPGDAAAWQAHLAGGPVLAAPRLVLATGGLSLPRTGSDGAGLALARSVGHSIAPTYPALVPLIAAEPAWRQLAGIAVNARLRAVEEGRLLEEREGSLLFTHRGFSGPVALDMSRHVTRPGSTARWLVSWGGLAVTEWEGALREPGHRLVAAVLRDRLPRRLADLLLERAGIPDGRNTSELRREERARLLEELTSCPLATSGNEGYAVAEVTAGGIPLAEVRPATLESKVAPGLFLCGEMLDVVGRIGGYNFLWAWVTGRLAGEGAARSMS
jgi:hypothetical protein